MVATSTMSAISVKSCMGVLGLSSVHSTVICLPQGCCNYSLVVVWCKFLWWLVRTKMRVVSKICWVIWLARRNKIDQLPVINIQDTWYNSEEGSVYCSAHFDYLAPLAECIPEDTHDWKQCWLEGGIWQSHA